MNSIEERANKWIVSNDTGSSSETIWAHMMGVGDSNDHSRHPSDPADLGRCLRLLFIIPEWAGRIQEMKIYGPGWAGLLEKWDELAAMMAEEVGINWHKGKSAPRTYKAMQLAIADGYRKDPDYECEFSKDGTLRSWRRKKNGESGLDMGEFGIRFGGS